MWTNEVEKTIHHVLPRKFSSVVEKTLEHTKFTLISTKHACESTSKRWASVAHMIMIFKVKSIFGQSQRFPIAS